MQEIKSEEKLRSDLSILLIRWLYRHKHIPSGFPPNGMLFLPRKNLCVTNNQTCQEGWGAAFVKGTCEQSNCVLVRDAGYSTPYNLAHEIGHRYSYIDLVFCTEFWYSSMLQSGHASWWPSKQQVCSVFRATIHHAVTLGKTTKESPHMVSLQQAIFVWVSAICKVFGQSSKSRHYPSSALSKEGSQIWQSVPAQSWQRLTDMFKKKGTYYKLCHQSCKCAPCVSMHARISFHKLSEYKQINNKWVL